VSPCCLDGEEVEDDAVIDESKDDDDLNQEFDRCRESSPVIDKAD